ncbi:MAG: hypothetical protein ACFFFG_09565 [Candidatus Thorarchaeota archaeon]
MSIRQISGQWFSLLILVIFIASSLSIPTALVFSGSESEAQDFVQISSLAPNEDQQRLTSPISYPRFSLQSFQQPNILFIMNDTSNLDPTFDQPFIDYLNVNLNFNVTLHNDNDSYSLNGIDAIIISDSVDISFLTTLETVSIPVLTMEVDTWNLFSLGSSSGTKNDNTVLDVVDTSHYITSNFTAGSLIVYNDPFADSAYIKGPFPQGLPAGSNLTGLIAPSTSGGERFARSLITLEKGGKDWLLNSSAERRVFLGASNGTSLTSKGWELWNRTVHWILYDDISGNASVTVNVRDLNNKDVQGANVTLADSFITLNQTTNLQGDATFYNVPWGKYDITADFNNTIEQLLNVEIIPNRTYHRLANFTFYIQLSSYLDTLPPEISHVHFEKSSDTFYADVIDDGNFNVYLNLTAFNLTSQSVKIPAQNFTMVFQSGITYFNDTALDSLNGEETNISITYNIIAIDLGGNAVVTETQTFLLSDPSAPVINKFNVTDYGEGTIEWYANVSDSSGIDSVVLSVNGSLKTMTLNGSGYWVYQTNEYTGNFLNYTIYSVNDTVGNENGSRLFPSTIKTYNFTVTDTRPPLIWNPIPTNSEGLVSWQVIINESSIYQSGLNASSVFIAISINGGQYSKYEMVDIGSGGPFYYEDTYNLGDSIEYSINASDLAGNLGVVRPGPFNVSDNAFPNVTLSAKDFGNGSIEFNATATDWPSNNTIAVIVYENSTGSWIGHSLVQINQTYFSSVVSNFVYNAREVIYYATAEDTANNIFIPTPNQYKKLILTDIVPPGVQFIIENSTINDAEITIRAWAEDVYGASQYVTNTFYLNITRNSVTNTYTMTQDVFYHVYTYQFLVGDDVTFKVWTEDDAGNPGSLVRSITVEDNAAPKINRWNIDEFQNGTVSVWAEVFEGPYGSGLDSDAPVTLEFIFLTNYMVPLKPNGSLNIYTITISDSIQRLFEPGDAFTYRLSAIDVFGNSKTTDWEAIFIIDLTPPEFIGYDMEQELENHTAVHLFFWVEASDPFGLVESAGITINQLIGSQWLNSTFPMDYNTSHYTFDIYVIPDTLYEYRFVIYDKGGNSNSTALIQGRTSDFVPVTALEYGFEYNSGEAGNATIWMTVNDPFNDHAANISIYNNDTREWEVIEASMESNMTHLSLKVHFEGIATYTYTIVLYDAGVLAGYYEPSQHVDSISIADKWTPTIHSANVTRLNDTTVQFWANVTDWGGNLSSFEVYVHYEIKPFRGVFAGIGAGLEIAQLNFNGSLFTLTVTLPGYGSLEWHIEASEESSGVSRFFPLEDYQFASLNIFIFGFTLAELAGAVLGTVFVGFLLVFGGIVLQRWNRKRIKKTRDIEEILSAISNIYTILVTTEAGIPLFDITNTIYRRDESLNVALSGLSVGMSDFLESFQSQFVEQIEESSNSSSDRLDDRVFRLSLIEQHKIQILIAASPTFRIFVFLGRKPTKFIRGIFFKAVRLLEEKIYLEDVGIVDEQLVGPYIRNIIDGLIPLTLLQQFTIDPVRLISIDAQIKEERAMQFSKAAINALKRLYIFQATSLETSSNGISDLNKFDRIVRDKGQRSYNPILYDDAKRAMLNLLKIPPEDVYEALWVGSTSLLKIIIPFDI